MIVLFILFLTLITYSQNIQGISLGDSLWTLNSSTTDDYFYFKAISSEDVQILLIDKNYIIHNIYYCLTFSLDAPTESTIKRCDFKFLDHYDYSKSSSSDYEYYYKISLSTSYNYVIIRYSGRNSNGLVYASAVIPYIYYLQMGDYSQTRLTTHTKNDTYFFTYISYPPSNYIYFNLTDTFDYLDRIIYYCFTNDNPSSNYLKANRSCIFSSLDYYKEGGQYFNREYYYQLYTYPYTSFYVFVKYKYMSASYGALYAKSSYYEFNKDDTPSKPSNSLSTLTIVFISIAGVAFLGIIIIIICYYCKKRATNNINYTSKEPAMVMSAPPASPFVEQNNTAHPPS